MKQRDSENQTPPETKEASRFSLAAFYQLSTAEKWIFSLMGVVLVMGGFHVAISAFNQPNNEVLAIALQSDGKTILAGRFTDFRISRKNTDGTDDTSFSSSWRVGGFNLAVLALAVQPSDDKIIAGGEFTNFDDSILGHVARLNADGSIDLDFTNAIGTGFNDYVTSVSMQPDGKILAGGLFTSFNGTAVNHIARLNSDGTLDSTLAAGGGFDAPVFAIVSEPSGQILVGGSFQFYQGNSNPYISRISNDGSPNSPSFSLKLTNP